MRKFGNSVEFDGKKDFVKISRYHFYPFSLSSKEIYQLYLYDRWYFYPLLAKIICFPSHILRGLILPKKLNPLWLRIKEYWMETSCISKICDIYMIFVIIPVLVLTIIVLILFLASTQ